MLSVAAVDSPVAVCLQAMGDTCRNNVAGRVPYIECAQWLKPNSQTTVAIPRNSAYFVRDQCARPCGPGSAEPHACLSHLAPPAQVLEYCIDLPDAIHCLTQPPAIEVFPVNSVLPTKVLCTTAGRASDARLATAPRRAAEGLHLSALTSSSYLLQVHVPYESSHDRYCEANDDCGAGAQCQCRQYPRTMVVPIALDSTLCACAAA